MVLSEGSAAEAIIASTAIPGVFAPIRYKDYYLADGAISSNTPIKVAVAKGARRLVILPTGYACSTHTPPAGAVANALHALTLLIARQLVGELEDLAPDIEYFVVPPLCPLVGSPYDFSLTADHIERAIQSTDAWLAQGGLEKRGIPDEMRPHSH
ncbi:MAG: patatin-like phospholipase family protein [Bradyrhizobium sp.]